MERVNKDFSVRIDLGDEQVLVDRVYDNIHIFPWIGHAILKLVTEEGMMQVHTTIDEALRVAEATGIKPLEREEISEREYEKYLDIQVSQLDDSLLE
jgi:hypothetical protein